jgi:hypothetical protein
MTADRSLTFPEPEKTRRPRAKPGMGLENLCHFWRLRRSLKDARARQLAEYMVEVLAESLEDADWKEALLKAEKRVTKFYP